MARVCSAATTATSGRATCSIDIDQSTHGGDATITVYERADTYVAKIVFDHPVAPNNRPLQPRTRPFDEHTYDFFSVGGEHSICSVVETLAEDMDAVDVVCDLDGLVSSSDNETEFRLEHAMHGPASKRE